MEINKYAHAPAVRRWAAALCLAILCTFWGWRAPAVYAQTADEDPPEVVSSSEIPEQTDPEEPGIPADFTRVAAVPANVDIPDFYQQVINVSGMYIFTLPDGTIHKRIYGAVDDVYGWYEPKGQDNIVYVGSPLIDTNEDALMYYAAVSKADREAMPRQDFSGLLPPEDGVTAVDQVQGVPVSELIFYCIAGVVGLCLVISIGALAVQLSGRSQKKNR